MVGGFGFDLSNRTILVSGASSGIGRHFARHLARNGARVVVGARRTDLLAQVVQEIKDDGGQALAVAMDANDEQSIMAAYDSAEAEFGVINSVIANAGINIGGSALGISADDFDRITSVNLRGVFLTAREGARRMIGPKGAPPANGRVVLISSITATAVFPYLAAYSATKAGVCQMARVLAREWADKGVNVNCLSPGYMQTELNDEYWSTDAGRALVNSFPRRKIMDISALDGLLSYLCSDASGPVTGADFVVDDGQTLA